MYIWVWLSWLLISWQHVIFFAFWESSDFYWIIDIMCKGTIETLVNYAYIWNWAFLFLLWGISVRNGVILIEVDLYFSFCCYCYLHKLKLFHLYFRLSVVLGVLEGLYYCFYFYLSFQQVFNNMLQGVLPMLLLRLWKYSAAAYYLILIIWFWGHSRGRVRVHWFCGFVWSLGIFCEFGIYGCGFLSRNSLEEFNNRLELA